MKMILTLAWRNIWRHTGRSGVLLAAISIGLWAGVLVVAWANGLVEQRLNYLIQSEISHAQIHHPEFLTERDPWMYLESIQELTLFLSNHKNVKAHSKRTLADGMLQSTVTTSGVRIRGVDSHTEPTVTTFHNNVIEGDYLSSDIRNPVLVGKRLAEKHNLNIGNRIVLNFQDTKGELISAAFNVVGKFQTASSVHDESTVFVNNSDLHHLLSENVVYHEIAIILDSPDLSETVMAEVNAAFPANSAQTWYELSPEVRYLTDSGGMMTTIIMTVIMLALAFGILNTMLMAIFERLRELGMLISIGMTRIRVFWMIIFESTMLTLTGALTGLLLARLSIAFLSENGVDLTMFGDGLAEWGYDAIIYPFMNPDQYIEVIIIVVMATMLASLYPAIKAFRINPLEVEKE